MHPELLLTILALILARCNCGKIGNYGQNEAVGVPVVDEIPREKREAEENGIAPEINEPTMDKFVSLMDIEEGKLTESGQDKIKTNSKSKRCPKSPFVGAKRSFPLLEAFKSNLDSISVVKRDSTKEECEACTNQASCKLLGKCAQCNKFCKGIAIYTDDTLTPWGPGDNVGMAPKSYPSNDIFSKTLFPLLTLREGEHKELICKLAGISDTSDIETVTVLVTTFTNRTPKGLNFQNDQADLKRGSPLKHKIGNSARQANPANIQSRFSDFENDLKDNSGFPRATNLDPEDLKTNPDLIEGPPPFLGSKNQIALQPKEFIDDDDNDVEVPQPPATPTFLEKLRNLSSRTLTPVKETSPNGSKGGFLQNLLKSSQVPPKNDMQTTPIRLPEETDDQFSKINQAIQEVKSMVKNMQEEASKASEQRLLGAAAPDESVTQTPNQLQSAVPDHVVDNFKKVNKYVLNRAQDALNMIKEHEAKGQNEVMEDPHSDVTKKVISDFKKMPQFILEKFKDTLNGFDKTADGTGDEVKLSRRFGGNVPLERETSAEEGNQILGSPEEVTTENFSTLPQDPPITYKNKLEKYLAELKDKRQKLYSPEKFTTQQTPPVLSPRNQDISRDLDENNKLKIFVVPQELEKQRDNLRQKLKKFVEDTKAKQVSPLPTQEAGKFNDYGGLPLQNVNSQQMVGDSNPRLEEKNPFLLPPNTSSQLTEKPTKLFKYLDDLKNKKAAASPKSIPSILPRMTEEGDDNKERLKEKIKNYVASLKKPVEGAVNGLQGLARKSTETQKEELNALKKKLEAMVKGRMLPAKLPPSLDPMVSESKPPTSTIAENSANEPSISSPSKHFDEVETPEQVNLQSRAGLAEPQETILDWSSNLGKIVQVSSKPHDIFFMGDGIKLPLQVKHEEDGSVGLSVDLNKLCSCKNLTCPKNHTAIEETVGAILEKEAQLKNQLTPTNLSYEIKPLFSGSTKNTKTNIFKRSSDQDVPDLPSIQEIQDSVTNSVKKIQDNVQEWNEEIWQSLGIGANKNPTSVQSVLDEIKIKNKNILDKLEEQNTLRNLLSENGPSKVGLLNIQTNIKNLKREYLKNLEREKLINKLMMKQVPDLLSNPLQNRVNSDISKMNEVYQTGKVNMLESKLKELDNEIEKYHDENEIRLLKESHKFLNGYTTDDVAKQEVDIVSKILSWLKNLTSTKNQSLV